MICMSALLMLAVSCKKDKKDEIENAGSGFRATVEQQNGDSKTHLEGLAVKWNSGDAILVKSSTCNTPKRFTTTGTDASANFDAAESLPDNFYTPNYTAYYPAAMFSGDQLTLPATQQYDENNTFANGANPMAATSSETLLPFKNVCGVLKLQLYSAADCQVRSISITSNTGEQLWGMGTVTLSGDIPSLGTLTGGGSSLTLDMGSTGMSMSKEEVNPTNYYFVVPAGTLGTSFTVKVTDTDGKVWTKTANSSANRIARSQITVMPKLSVVPINPIVPSTVTVTAGCVSCIYSVGGTVTVPSGGPHTCEYGLVYCPTSAGHIPTVADSKIVVNTETFNGIKTFTADLGVLEDGVEYKVRAYAMIEGVTYSSESTVQTVTGGNVPQPLPDEWINRGGKSPKKFSVSATQTVYFSQGNLQYTTTGTHSVAGGDIATGTWRFAEHQFDIIGADNENVAQTYTGWIDLFGWGTSGWNNGNLFYQPYDTHNSSPSDVGFGYGPTDGTSYYFNLTGDYANADWGVYNAISNGGNQAGKWRTLTGGEGGEWDYLINSRTNASNLYGEGKVGSCTPGLIILPDDWVLPRDLRFKPGMENGYETNVYTYSQWARMEAAGAVFLPAAGTRYGTSVDDVGSYGNYLSSSYYNKSSASELYFYSGDVYSSVNSARYGGCSVRLVSDN